MQICIFVWMCVIKGNGNPLQNSYLKNPTDRGAWRATVHGIAKSWTRLKWLSTHTCIVCVCLYFIYLLFTLFLKIFFDDHFLKFSLTLLHYCFCFMSWVFSHRVCVTSAPQPETKPAPFALEGEVLTTGPPGKSLFMHFLTHDSSTLSFSCSRIPGPPPTS